MFHVVSVFVCSAFVLFFFGWVYKFCVFGVFVFCHTVCSISAQSHAVCTLYAWLIQAGQGVPWGFQ